MFIFLGEYTHQVDDKGRIRIPLKLKNGLGSDPFIFKGVQKCIKVYPRDVAEEKLAKTFSNGNLNDEEAEREKGRFMSKAAIGEEDKQGRIMLPSSLLKHAGIACSSTIVTVGAYDHVQIWDKDEWEKNGESEHDKGQTNDDQSNDNRGLS